MATWNAVYESNPSNAGTATSGYASIKDPKTEVRIRMQNEHDTYSRASSGADGSRLQDWVHIQGAARTYYTTATPTNRPDGSTALSSNDDGRLFAHSGDVLKAYSGSGFCNVPPVDTSQSKALQYSVYSIGILTLPNDISGEDSVYFKLGNSYSGTDKYISLVGIPETATIIRLGWTVNDDTGEYVYNYPFLLSAWENIGGSRLRGNLYAYLSNSKYFVYGQASPSSAMRTGKTWSSASVNRGYITVWYYE